MLKTHSAWMTISSESHQTMLSTNVLLQVVILAGHWNMWWLERTDSKDPQVSRRNGKAKPSYFNCQNLPTYSAKESQEGKRSKASPCKIDSLIFQCCMAEHLLEFIRGTGNKCMMRKIQRMNNWFLRRCGRRGRSGIQAWLRSLLGALIINVTWTTSYQ